MRLCCLKLILLFIVNIISWGNSLLLPCSINVTFHHIRKVLSCCKKVLNDD
nr:MAG TPA: Seven transmembrane helix receptor, peptide, ECD1, Agonist, Family B1 [Caudoviricetes sp.]